MVKYVFDLDLTLYSTLDYKVGSSLQKMYADFKPKLYLRGLLNAIPHDKYIITNGNKLHCSNVLQRLHLNGIFKDIIASDHVKNLKPHDEPYELAHHQFDIKKDNEEVIYFEDNIENLEKAKYSYGWTTVLLTNDFENKDYNKHNYPFVDFVFRNIEEALLFFMVKEHLHLKNKRTK